MRMLKSLATFALFLQSFACLSAEMTYQEAEKVWEETKDNKSYGEYTTEFANFNNYHHLDEKDGCYRLGREKIRHFLIITHTEGEKYGVIHSVVSNVDTEKSQCFKNTYKGLKVKIPPYLPFVLQMDFGT